MTVYASWSNYAGGYASFPGEPVSPTDAGTGPLLDLVFKTFVRSNTADVSWSLSAAQRTATADGHSPVQLLLVARDCLGQPQIGLPVSLSVSGAGAQLSPSSGALDSNGTFSSTLTSTQAGTHNINAIVGGSGDAVAQTSATFLSGGGTGYPARLAFIEQPTTVVAGAPFSPAVVVAIEDAQGNILTDADSQITISLNGSATALSGTTIWTPASGGVLFDDLSIAMPGQGYTLFASTAVPWIANATSASFDVVAP
jgi:hypothetical protein